MCVCVYMCVCVRACVRVCVCACLLVTKNGARRLNCGHGDVSCAPAECKTNVCVR